jgi:hypothetical protein
MKQDEIIDMAIQAGIDDEVLVPWSFEIQAFAKMCFEKGRQQGMKQERALEKLAETSREIGWNK